MMSASESTHRSNKFVLRRLLLGALILAAAGGGSYFLMREHGRSSQAAAGKDPAAPGQAGDEASAFGHRENRGAEDTAARIRSMLQLKEGEIGVVSAPHGTFGHRVGPVADGRVADIGAIFNSKQVSSVLKAVMSCPGAGHPAFQMGRSGAPLNFRNGDIGLAASSSPEAGENVDLRLTTDAPGRKQETTLQLEKGSAVIVYCGDSDMMVITGR